MAEYIEREAAIEATDHAYNEWNLAMAAADGKREINLVFKRQELCKAVASVFASAPAADVAPVVHGRWVYDENAYDWSLGGYVCGLCYALNTNLPSNEKLNPLNFRGSAYCPNCGAKMDGGDDGA